MGLAGSLRRRLLQRWLGRQSEGPNLLALIDGRCAAVPSSAAQTTLAAFIARRAWRQGDIARRIEALYAAGEPKAANFLLDAAAAACPDSHLFIGARFNRWTAERRSDETVAYARELMDRGTMGLPVLQCVIVGLRRAGLADTHPLLVRAWRRWRDTPANPVERGLAEARLYRALGATGAARHRLNAARTVALRRSDRKAVGAALADLADARDRWLEADAPKETGTPAASARAVLAGLYSRKRLVSESGPLFPADLAGEPLVNAFAWLLDGETAERADYRPANRLLLIGNTLACGGMERIMAQTYRHFSASGDFDDVDLALINFEADGPDGFYAGEAGVGPDDVVLLDRSSEPSLPFTLLPGSWKARSQKLFDHVCDTRPRVIHAWNDLTGLLAAFAGLRAGCPRIVVHFHHGPAMPLSNPASQLASYPEAYRRLTARPEISTIFCAKAAARDYARWWQLPFGEAFHTVYNGIEWPETADRAAARAVLGLPGEAPVIGAVMSFKDVKQPLLWADAGLELAALLPDVRFLMVGEGPMQAEVAARFAAAGRDDRLILPGQVADVASYYAAMDIFWLTSKTEGLPNVCVEAQLSGVPVVAFDAGGTSETFIDGESGIAVRPGDVSELARVTRALIADPARLDAMAARAQIQARERFSPPIFFAALRDVYEG